MVLTMNTTPRIVMQWHAGKRLLTLTEESGRYSYDGNGCGGTLRASTDEEAIAQMESDTGAAGAMKLDFPRTKRFKR